MATRLFLVFIPYLVVFSSCQSQTTAEQNVDTAKSIQPPINQGPNFSYSIDVPDNWTVLDTIMQEGLRVRLLLPPPSLQTDSPAGNVLIASMEGRSIDDFTTRNINYLESNMPGVVILDRGSIDSIAYEGQWFTYIREQDGIVRDMINYIIPQNGFAYMITFGSNKGSINKYRVIFDKIARSFKG